jgi:hypothetical protein
MEMADSLLLELVGRLAERLRVVEPVEARAAELKRRLPDLTLPCKEHPEEVWRSAYWISPFCWLQLLENSRGDDRPPYQVLEGDCLTLKPMRLYRANVTEGPPQETPPRKEAALQRMAEEAFEAGGLPGSLRLYRKRGESPRAFVDRAEAYFRQNAPYVRIGEAKELARVQVDF